MVSCAVTLRDTVTGRVASVKEQFESAVTAEFWWTDGNGACDCERLRQLWAAFREPDPNIPCGDDRVEIIAAAIDGVAVEGWS